MKSKHEMPSVFMERVFSTMYSSQMDIAPPVARALVYITKTLRSEGIDKDVKEYLIKIQREKPNLEVKDEVMPHFYAMESDLTAKEKMDKKEKERLNLVNSGEQIK